MTRHQTHAAAATRIEVMQKLSDGAGWILRLSLTSLIENSAVGAWRLRRLPLYSNLEISWSPGMHSIRLPTAVVEVLSSHILSLQPARLRPPFPSDDPRHARSLGSIKTAVVHD